MELILGVIVLMIALWWFKGKQLIKKDEAYFIHRLATYGALPDLIPVEARTRIVSYVRELIEFQRTHGMETVSMMGERHEVWHLDEAAKLAAYVLSPSDAIIDISEDEIRWQSYQSIAGWLLPILDEFNVDYEFPPHGRRENKNV